MKACDRWRETLEQAVLAWCWYLTSALGWWCWPSLWLAGQGVTSRDPHPGCAGQFVRCLLAQGAAQVHVTVPEMWLHRYLQDMWGNRETFPEEECQLAAHTTGEWHAQSNVWLRLGIFRISFKVLYCKYLWLVFMCCIAHTGPSTELTDCWVNMSMLKNHFNSDLIKTMSWAVFTAPHYDLMYEKACRPKHITTPTRQLLHVQIILS